MKRNKKKWNEQEVECLRNKLCAKGCCNCSVFCVMGLNCQMFKHVLKEIAKDDSYKKYIEGFKCQIIV